MNNGNGYNDYGNGNMNNMNGGGYHRPSGPTQSQVQRHSLEKDMDAQRSSTSTADMSHLVLGQNDYHTHHPHKRGVMGWLQNHFGPAKTWLKKFNYKREESSRLNKGIIMGTLICGIVISVFAGKMYKQGIVVKNTSPGTKRTFVNSDHMRLLSETYDKHNESMVLSFRTDSASGAVSPNVLKTQFVLAQGPKGFGHTILHHKVKRPTLNLIPTFNNHFVVVIHHLYSGFDGVRVLFHNSSALTPATLNHALSDYQNGDNSNFHISKKDQDRIENLAQKGATNYKTSAKDIKFIHKLEHRNNIAFVIGERYSDAKHAGYVDPDASPYDIAMTSLKKHLKFDYKDVAANHGLVNREKRQIKADQGKIRQINHDADTGNKRQELSSTRSEVQMSNQSIKNYNNEIKKLQKDINITLSRISKLKNHISVLPRQATPSPGKLFKKKVQG